MRTLYDDKSTPREIFERHRDWGADTTASQKDAATQIVFTNSRDPDRRLRVAYLSGDFRTHSVGYFFQPLLAHHDHRAVEVICYSEVDNPDAMTKELRAHCSLWRDSYKMTDTALRAQLLADRIDVAIDLAGQTAKNRLRALAVKTTPVTATWLGYPATTGLSTIDWRITDDLADPPGVEAFYTEKLLRLDGGFLCYAPPADAPAVAPLPSIATGRITFGSFNNMQKISESTIDAWAAILRAAPESRLVLKAPTLVDRGLRQRYQDAFVSRGVDPARVELRTFIVESASHLAAYGEIDIALDPFPYNGTTTSCEAMWMGVPVLTVIGNRHAGRVGFDLLNRIGYPELAAADQSAYVAQAVQLARDPLRLQRLRSDLRERMHASSLCDAPHFARAFEQGIRVMWRQWCVSPTDGSNN
jgi:predicted O-linked N-acetylglucosamine transferase (SPINDLY family)